MEGGRGEGGKDRGREVEVSFRAIKNDNYVLYRLLWIE